MSARDGGCVVRASVRACLHQGAPSKILLVWEWLNGNQSWMYRLESDTTGNTFKARDTDGFQWYRFVDEELRESQCWESCTVSSKAWQRCLFFPGASQVHFAALLFTYGNKKKYNLRKQSNCKLLFPAKSFSIQTLFTPLFTPGTHRLEFALALKYSYPNYSNEMAVMVVV